MSMSGSTQKLHPVRIFLASALITIASLAWVGGVMGPEALIVAIVLIVVEITFSFENAIINAKVLNTMSIFWRKIFITIGILIAVFGMRVVFPIAIVAITANLPMGSVLDLALNNPDKYSSELDKAHIPIAAFGGMFLMMLALHFFFDSNRKVQWISIIERPMQRLGKWKIYGLVSLIVLTILTLLPANHDPKATFSAGIIGIITYLGIHGLTDLFAKKQGSNTGKILKTGMAGFMSFMYLEVLDASFSFDSVIGAFAVTKDVVLIAIGLGIGALWVRSITIYMVEHQVLHAYRYLEHGAHYTIGVLSVALLAGIFFDFPEAIAGIAGIIIITLAIVGSIKIANIEKQAKEAQA